MAGFGVGILAGGNSTRMGRDKALLRYGGETLLERLIREFSGGELLLSAAEAGRYERFGCRVVYDERRGVGPLEGIRRLLTEAESEALFLCAADMPLLRRELAEYVAAFVSSDYDCYIVTRGGRREPLCGIYTKKALPAVEERLAAGRYRLAEVLRRARTKDIPLEYSRFDGKMLENVNTPRDYARLFAPRVFCVCGEKNSGKTTLVCRLIEAFRRDGYRVAALKHDGHDCFADAPGTDTARYAEAGASCAAIFTRTRFALTARESVTPEALIARIGGMADAPDILIVEGLKASAYPKLELRRGGGEGPGVCPLAPPMLLATEKPPAEGLPVPAFQRDDVPAISAWLTRALGMEEFAHGDAE